MESGAIGELRSRKRLQTLRLIEANDLTKQIAEAAERGDMIAAQMLLGEREEPVRAAYEVEEQIRAYLQGLPEQTAIRLSALLRGADAESEEEQPLVDQVTQYRRLLGALTEADKRLSIRIGGKRSFYEKFKE